MKQKAVKERVAYIVASKRSGDGVSPEGLYM